jgi:hypothetical protein
MSRRPRAPWMCAWNGGNRSRPLCTMMEIGRYGAVPRRSDGWLGETFHNSVTSG